MKSFQQKVVEHISVIATFRCLNLLVSDISVDIDLRCEYRNLESPPGIIGLHQER